MAVDVSLLSTLLDVLVTLGNHALPAKALARETELRFGRPLVQSDVDDLLAYGKDQGWIGSRVDTFQREVFYITPEGKTARESF